jgi:hypothetical protein
VTDRSVEIDQAEARLHGALFATVGGARPLVTPQQVMQAIAASFNVTPDNMSVAASELEDFLIFLPDDHSTDRVFNGGAPFHALGFTLFFRCWTRVEHSQAFALPTFIHVELRDIPAHAWSKSTVQQLLGPACWVQSVQVATQSRRELLVFRLLVWCRRSDLLPPAVDLFIPEPAVAVLDHSSEKPGLTYPVRLRVLDGSDQGHRRRRHRRHHRSSPPQPSSETVAPTAQRVPVHARLRPSSSGHVEAAHSPTTCGASHALNALPAQDVAVSCTPASPVPNMTSLLRLEDRCSAGIEKLPSDLRREPVSPVPACRAIEDIQANGLGPPSSCQNGPLQEMSGSDDDLGPPSSGQTGPENLSSVSPWPGLDSAAQDSILRSVDSPPLLQEPRDDHGEDLAGSVASILPTSPVQPGSGSPSAGAAPSSPASPQGSSGPAVEDRRTSAGVKLVVYSRCQTTPRSALVVSTTHDDQSTPQASSFISKLSKVVENGRVQPPPMPKRRPKLPPGVTPWRSCWIAGLDADAYQQQVPGHTRSKKTLMH